MLQYLLTASAIWLLSLVLFDVFLRGETYHGYNRLYLLFTFLSGCIIPLLLWFNGNRSDPYFSQIFSAAQLWVKCLVLIYSAGALVALSLFTIDVLKLVRFYRKSTKSKQNEWTIVETGKQHPPFSYLDILFVPEKGSYSDGEWEMIINHEQQHSIQLHLIDILLLQLAWIIFWFHPLVYIYNSRLLLVHEYQADKAASQQPQEYGRFLVEQAVLQAAPIIAHSFNRSPIKNRIVMLTKNAFPRTGTSNLKLLLVLPLTLIGLLFFIKNSYSENKIKAGGADWKKVVSRVVDIREKQDTILHHLRDISPDATLLEMIVKEIKAGSLTAYSNRDGNFTTKLTIDAVNEMFPPHFDTFILTDPLTDKKATKIAKNDFDYASIHKYRILEEWIYNPATDKTEIQIKGISPLMNFYGCDGSFHGHRAMFSVRYSDIKNLIANYELYHPNNSLASHIWDDYFNSDEEKTQKE